MAANERSRSVSTLNRLIFLAILIPLAIIVVGYFLSNNSPFKSPPAPAPILVGQILKQYKMETAEVTSSKIVEGETSSLLPFSKDKLTYQVVLTMTAGIDMSTIQDSDIVASGDMVTIKLPAPQVLRIERTGKVISQNSEMLSAFSKNPNLQDMIEDEGQKQIVKAVLEQGKLMQDARQYAEDNLRNLFLQAGFKQVQFIQSDTKITPTPQISRPPS
ncbi:MAG: hypothetical protein JWP00_383 [Chloroflexi bacterium]|jgi:hypothetical protein|nr:hypothetical protein [Chloroflexota bacterium]